jgi:hypothetical protein
VAGDAVRLILVLDHLRRHAAALEREVHLLALFVGHALIDFAVDEERRRLDVPRIRER